jgi:tetratricopeptide (TPR) repeat protein
MSKELKQEDERVLYEAGYLLLKKGNIKAAREVFEGLVAMTPNKGLPHTFLGNTYFAESKFDDAIKHHRKAVELSPDSAVSWAHLGESLVVTQQKDEAVSVLKKVLALDSEGPSGKMARGLLELVGSR